MGAAEAEGTADADAEKAAALEGVGLASAAVTSLRMLVRMAVRASRRSVVVGCVEAMLLLRCGDAGDRRRADLTCPSLRRRSRCVSGS